MSILDLNSVSINSVTKTQRDALTGVSEGLIVYNSDNNSIEYYDGTKWRTLTGILNVEATGGTEIIDGNAKLHVFTSPGNFVVTGAVADASVEYLVVAGGGGGGHNGGGGGGAGGFRTGTNFPVTTGTFPITVGGGGSGGTAGVQGGQGNSSTFSSITSTGGGGGGSRDGTLPATIGVPGGSGGGGGGANTPPPSPGGTGNTPPVSPPQGNPGGGNSGSAGTVIGGGGGGRGAAGANAVLPNAGPGGIGSPITWVPASYGTPGPAPGRYFSGGGGGGKINDPTTNVGTGGAGGGGGGSAQGIVGGAGGTNTGGGGGGNVGTGGSGIVIIRYLIA